MESNPLAERRRLRKLEIQRLEEEARRKQEELRVAKERELERIENEKKAEELRKAQEIERIRLALATEVARVKGLEDAERSLINKFERQLKLVGAYCVSEISLNSSTSKENGSPLSIAFLSISSLEKPIIVLNDDIIFIGDSIGLVHAFTNRDHEKMFSIGHPKTRNGKFSTISSLIVTRNGHLIVCEQDAHSIHVFDIRAMVLYQPEELDGTSIESSRAQASHLQSIGAEKAATVGFFHLPRGLTADDTSQEIYISDQMNHRIQVFTWTTQRINTKTASLNVKQTTTDPALAPPTLAIVQPSGESQSPVVTPMAPSIIQVSSYTFSRVFGSKGHGKGQLLCPAGLSLSHYHIIVCDTGNNRLVAFTKKGMYVRCYGEKGTKEKQFMDIRDVKLVNVRKKAITRGFSMGRGQQDENLITTEQFEIVIADYGNFRVQLLQENGEFLRIFSTLGTCEHLENERKVLNGIQATLIKEMAPLKGFQEMRQEYLRFFPSDQANANCYFLSKWLHPTSKKYRTMTHLEAKARFHHSRLHHPLSIDYDPTKQQFLIVDKENGKVFFYNVDGSRAKWLQQQLPLDSEEKEEEEKDQTMVVESLETNRNNPVHTSSRNSKNNKILSSVHSILCSSILSTSTSNSTNSMMTSANANATNGSRNNMMDRMDSKTSSYKELLYVSDPLSHRIAVLDSSSLELVFYIGATTYGDQKKCANGFLPGELNGPTYIALYSQQTTSTTDHHDHHDHHDHDHHHHQQQQQQQQQLLVVSDTGNHRLSVFDAKNGTFVRQIGQFGHLEKGLFDHPQGLSILENRWLYIVDQCNHRIQVFDLIENIFTQCFGTQGNNNNNNTSFNIEFNFPTGIAVTLALPIIDPKCRHTLIKGTREAKIIVADTGNHRIQCLDLSGQILFFVIEGKIKDMLEFPMIPLSICFHERSGCFVVCDVANQCLLFFQPNGNLLTICGSNNLEKENRFLRPTSVCTFYPGMGSFTPATMNTSTTTTINFNTRSSSSNSSSSSSSTSTSSIFYTGRFTSTKAKMFVADALRISICTLELTSFDDLV